MIVYPDVVSNNHLFSGVWKTTNENKITMITAVSLKNPEIFKIVCNDSVDGNCLEFKIIVEGPNGSCTHFFNEGSEILVEGTRIYIEQLSNGYNGGGQWEIVKRPIEKNFISSKWLCPVGFNKGSLVAAFNEPTEFVFTISHSPGKFEPKVQYHITIDGVTVKDPLGRNTYFLEGSSIIGSGKEIAILVVDLSRNKNRKEYNGTLKISKN